MKKDEGRSSLNLTNVVITIVAIFLALNTITFVGAGDRCVLTTWGAVSGTVLQPGLNFKIPIANGAECMSVQTQKVTADAEAASQDLQIVSSTVALNYHVNPDTISILYRDVGRNYESKVIDQAIQESVKASTALYTAEELIGLRASVKEDIRTNLKNRLAVYNIEVEDISITNFDFSPEFNAQIEAKVTALQRALTEENNLKAIEFQAQQKIAQAEGEAQATLRNAQAEAEAIRITGQALKENPKLVDLEWVKRWNGQMPHTTIGGSGVVPILDIT